MAGRHVISYAAGDVYDGEWSSDGKRHGRGTLTFANGAKYSGEFVNGFFQGSGILAFPDGGRYEGQFELGKYQGLGVFSNTQGMKFEVGISYMCVLIIFVTTLMLPGSIHYTIPTLIS